MDPILKPDFGEWLLGDPTIIKLGNEIHMWGNEVFHGIVHYKSKVYDPLNFTRLSEEVWEPGAVRPHALLDGEKILIFYEQYLPPLFHSSEIRFIECTLPPIRSIDDPMNWSRP